MHIRNENLVLQWLRRVIFIAANACFAVAMAGEAEWNGLMEAGRTAYLIGDQSGAIAYLQEALKEAEAFGERDTRLALALHELARSHSRQGNLNLAEPLFWRSLAIREKALGPLHRDVADTLQELGSLYANQGRHADADPLYRRAWAIWAQMPAAERLDVALSLDDWTLLRRIRLRDGDDALRLALANRESKLGAEHPEMAKSLSTVAMMYQSEGSYSYAEPLYQRALAIWEKRLGSETLAVAKSLTGLGHVYHARGRYAEADSLFQRSLAIYESVLGAEHPEVGKALAGLAFAYNRERRFDEALAFARRATRLLAERYTGREEASRGALLFEQRTQSWRFDLHLALLSATGSAQAAGEGFEVEQFARVSDTAEQVERMAVRQAAGSDALAQIVRSRQDAAARLQDLDSRIVQAVSRLPEHRDLDAEARIRAEAVEAKRTLAALDARIEKEYPRYRELTNPRPVPLPEAQKLLRPDEALIVFLVARDASYVWAVGQGAVTFQRIALTGHELATKVSKLRAQLDLGVIDPSAIFAKPFDVATAHELYRELFGPAAEVMRRAKALLIVPDGALTSLPLGVLVTDPPAAPLREGRPDDHAQVAWLAKKYATTVLPSVSSLRVLREFTRASLGSEPFGGFGNPLLQGDPAMSRARRKMSFFTRGAIADSAEIRRFYAPLPETESELRSIAKSLGAPERALYLGQDATETKVKSLDLSRFRNLAFATHAAVAGAFTGVAEPGLVLTPPETATEQDDGFLTASEIAQLKLNADWVILSACNTAAPDGTPGAEGYSGLAKAFFYAGARALLVSHWSVSSEAARALTSRMFEEAAKGANKAEALRRSMLALMQRRENPYFAHPSFWAPFVVVGEGNSR